MYREKDKSRRYLGEIKNKLKIRESLVRFSLLEVARKEIQEIEIYDPEIKYFNDNIDKIVMQVRENLQKDEKQQNKRPNSVGVTYHRKSEQKSVLLK